MAERGEDLPDEIAGGQSAPVDTVDAALALGLSRRRARGATDPKMDAFLEKQTRLIDLQTEHLHELRAVTLSRLLLGRWKDRVSLALQVMTAFAGLAVVVAIAVMAWQAHQDHGVIIEAFSVPPDLAQRGLTGQVVASDLLDRLSELQAETVTARPASTYADDWGNDIKVEIPETGVSIGELGRGLRRWLGSQTRINGDVVRTPAGLAVVARTSETSGRRFEGAEADLDKLVGQAAESIYARTQPYRYAVWLSAHGRRDEAIAVFTQLAAAGSPGERAWAYAGRASMLVQDGRYREAATLAYAALRLEPRLEPAYRILGQSLSSLGRTEEVVSAVRRHITLLQSGRAMVQKGDAARLLPFLEGALAQQTGDYRPAVALYASATDRYDFEGHAGAYGAALNSANSLTSDHDVSAARRAVPDGPGDFPLRPAELEDWNGLAANFPAALVPTAVESGTLRWASAARAYAHLGRFADAEAFLSKTPLDCDFCLRTRGEVAALKHDWPAADRWYAEAARQGPSLPFAYTDWGQALLARGDVDGALAKLTLARQKSPHFADPLELWGEALVRKGDYAGAVAKFAEADKDAPRWGRNHLHCGEALAKLGRIDEAKAQWRAAAGMDLSVGDAAELARAQVSAPKQTS